MQSGTYLASLTSLRGIAAVLVIFLHIDGVAFQLAPPDSYFFIRKGYLWVDFFFMLSGFIMSHVYGNAFLKNRPLSNVGRFMWARFARIYPLHVFSFLCMVAFYAWYRTNYAVSPFYHLLYNSSTVLSHVLLLQGMGVNSFLSWNAPSWSISTEWWMYLLFPWLLLLFKKPSVWKRMGILLSIITGYFLIIYYFRPLSTAASPYPDPDKLNTIDVTYDYGFIRCFLGFLFGMLLHDLYTINWLYSFLSKRYLILLTSILIFLALSFNLSDVVAVLLFAVLILTSTYNSRTTHSVFTAKPLLFLGNISYSLYLMHLPLLYFLLGYMQRFPGVMRTDSRLVSWGYSLIFLSLVIGISTPIYWLFELPVRKKLNNLIDKRIHSEKQLLS